MASKQPSISKNNGSQKISATADNINGDDIVNNELPIRECARNGTTDESSTLQSDSDIVNNKSSSEACVFCAEACMESNSASCEDCDHWYHLECCGIKGEDAFRVKSLMSVLGWTCRACRIDSFNIIRKLQTEVEMLRSTQLLQKTIDRPTDVDVKCKSGSPDSQSQLLPPMETTATVDLPFSGL